MASSLPVKSTAARRFSDSIKSSAGFSHRFPVRTGWRQTLWKDFRTVGPTFLVTILGLIFIQLLFVLYRFSMGTPYTAHLFGYHSGSPPALLFMSAPFIILLGCAAQLIGADRESNTWNWCSSLPIDWRLSLFSKLAVTATLSLLAALLTVIVPATFQLLPDFWVTHGFFEAVAAFINTVLVWAQLLTLSYLCLLLFNEPLKALFVAIGVLIASQSLSIGLLTGYLVSLWQTVIGTTGSLSQTESVAYISLNCLMVAIQFSLLLWFYRWRWYSGQQTDWMSKLWGWWESEDLQVEPHSSGSRRQIQAQPELTAVDLRRQDRQASESIVNQAYRNRWLNALHPSSLGTELWLAVHNQFRIIAVIAVLAILVSKVLFSRFVDPRTVMIPKPEWLAVIAVCTAILGAITFMGDQERSRYRFLADRGASVWHVLLARLTVSALAVVLTVLLVSQFFLIPAGQTLSHVPPAVYELLFPVPRGPGIAVRDSFQGFKLGSVFGLAILLYLWQIGVLASICFRRPISAFFAAGSTIAVMTAMSLFVLYLLATRYGENIPVLRNLFLGPALLLTPSLATETSTAAFLFLSFAGVLLSLQFIALWRFTRRLLVMESPALEFRFLLAVPGSFLAAFLFISFATATFGFLALPAYDEKKLGLLSVDQLIQQAEFEQPDLSEVEALGDRLIPAEELVARLKRVATDDENYDLSSALSGFWNRLCYDPTTRQFVAEVSSFEPNLDETALWRRATEEMSALESSLPKPFRKATLPDQLFLAPVSRAAMRAALIGKLAGLDGESDLSLRGWTVAHRLMSHEQFQSVNTWLPHSDLWLLISTLTEEEIRLLGGPEVVRSILPPGLESWKQQVNTAVLYDTSIRVRWLETPEKIPDALAESFYLGKQFPFLVRYYPPLRWLSQRNFVQWLNIEVIHEFPFDQVIKAEQSLLELLDRMESE